MVVIDFNEARVPVSGRRAQPYDSEMFIRMDIEPLDFDEIV